LRGDHHRCRHEITSGTQVVVPRAHVWKRSLMVFKGLFAQPASAARAAPIENLHTQRSRQLRPQHTVPFLFWQQEDFGHLI
jgi:hypothetical protein